MKRAVVALFTLSMVFGYAFSTNSANAAVGSQEVKLDVGFACTITLPGGITTDPTEFPLIIKATVPDWVAPNEEFYLTNASIEMVIFEDLPASYFPVGSTAESPVFRISSENTETSIMSGPYSDQEIPRPGEGSIFLPSEGEEVEVGPFTAGEEGEVIIKAQELGMNVNIGLPVALTCVPTEEQSAIIASIPIDSEAPKITLNGDNSMIVKQGDLYEEPGATAQDNFDGDVSDDIEISGEVDSNTIGEYTITYTVSDSVGNETTVDRIVNVVEPFGSWYTGEGPPSGDLGSNGDSYLDIATGDVYKRDPNTWTKIGNLKGDDGKQGSEILTGSGAPTADAGDVGDLYLDTKSGDVFEKTADGWNQIANLEGPEGPQGPQGSTGSGGDNGAGGDGDGKGNEKSPSTDKNENGKSDQGGKLPKTATSLPTLMLIGILLITAGGVLFLRRRKAIE